MNTTITLNTGAPMPLIGLGTWKASTGEVGSAVTTAIRDAGYRHIDCAHIYGNEKEIGQALHDLFTSGVVKREELFITSKLWNTDHAPADVIMAIKRTLNDLQLEYLDLYLMHWGVAFHQSEEKEPLDAEGNVITAPVSIQQTWQAMEQLVEKGLVKAIGVSNFTGPMIVDLLTYASIKPAMNQIELHPYNTQTELVEYCQRQGIAVTGYSPLGGSPNPDRPDAPDLKNDPTIIAIAAAHHKSVAQILLNWGVGRGTVVIPKSLHTERITENKEIFDFSLTPEERTQIDSLNKNYRFVNPSEWWKLPYFE